MTFWKVVEIDESANPLAGAGYMSPSCRTKDSAFAQLASMKNKKDGKHYEVAETDELGTLVRLLDSTGQLPTE